MVAAAILKICENLTKSQAKYCVLCLRTECVRNLSSSSSLQKLIDVMNHRTAWSWKKSPFNSEKLQDLRVCRVCEARMATAVKVMDAIKFGMLSSRLIEYYRANPNPTVEALDQYLVTINEKRNQSRYKEAAKPIQPKHPMVHVAVECNSLVERVRKFTSLQVTETLIVSSGWGNPNDLNTQDTPQSKTSALNSLAVSEPAIDIIEHGIKVEGDFAEHSINVDDDVIEHDVTEHDVIEHDVTVEDDKIDECEVLIENDIKLPQESEIFEEREETEIFVIEDDEDIRWVPNKSTKRKIKNKRKNNTKNKNDSNAQPITKTTPRAINTVPIEKLLAPSGNSQSTFLVPPTSNDEVIVATPLPKTVRNLVTPVGIGANSMLNNQNPNASLNPVFIPDCGEGQKLAIQCPESTNFMLHQIIAQPDGTLLVPSLPGRIVNGHLEIMQNPEMAIVQQTTNSGTITQIAPPTLVLNGGSNSLTASPVRISTGSLDSVKKGSALPVTCNIAPKPKSQASSIRPNILTKQTKFFGGVQQKPIAVYGVKRKTNEPDDSSKKKVEATPPQPMATSVLQQMATSFQQQMETSVQQQMGTSVQQTMATSIQPQMATSIQQPTATLQPGNSFGEPNSQPKMNSSNIDWEDKIPMDVITYMDATDPSANIQPPTQEETQMGIISNVYSQKEVEDASSQLERILRSSKDGSDVTCRVISID